MKYSKTWSDEIPAIPMFMMAKIFAEAKGFPFFTMKEHYMALRLYETIAGGYVNKAEGYYDFGLN